MKNVGTWTWNEEAEEFVWSPQMCAIMGRDPGKARLSKAEAKSFYPSDIWQQLQDALHNTLRHGTPFEIEYQLTSAKGEIQWLQQRGILNTDKQLSNAAAIKHVSTVRGMVEDISTTKQVNQRFQNSNHDLMNLIDALPVCISYIDKEYRYQFANKTYERWFGYDKTEVIGLKVSVVVGEQAFEKSLPHLSRALTGEFVSFETYMKYVTGNDRWVTIELYPDMDIDGVRGVYAFVQDISQQKKSEEQYKQNEELWKMALEVSGDGVWDWYPQTGVEILSPRLKEIYGYGNTDINDLSEELDKRTHPEDLAKMYADRQAHFDGLTPIYINEHRVQCKDGTWKWILTRGTVIQRNTQGLPVRVIGTHTDISERKNAETALKESAERLRMALLANHQGLYDLNIQTGITTINEEYANMLGYTIAEMNETSSAWFSRLHPDDAERATAIYENYIAGKISEYRVEFRQKTRTGEWRWLQSIGTIVERDQEGKPVRMVGTHLDITERKNAEAMIWQQANIDTLTGLPNRRMFYDRLEQDIKKSKRNGRSLAVLFIDLDHFKEVNDTLGHSVGDILLVEAAKRLLTCVRESDTVARLGGDEFTVSLPDQHNPEDVEQIAQSIIKKMSGSFQLANEEVFLSASIGITLYPDDAVSLDDLLKNADQAMYAAKNAGRNRFNYFTPSLQVAALARLRLGSDLRIAIAEQQLSVYFQPIIDLNTGIIQKAEALIRWQHPQRGFISPLEFIAIAETSDLIFDIGETVFKASVRWLQRWRNLYPAQKNFQISINQSPVEFQRDGSRYANWINHLHEAELPGQAITIEITEGLLLDASTLVSDKLLQFRDAGMQVALDDFGTGYSSLSYLKKFDIDYLKIDQSFVRNMTPGSSDSALAEAIIVMAHKLGLKVIAEGVETEEQRDLLKQAGCNFAQGYLFSRPIPPEDFERLLAG